MTVEEGIKMVVSGGIVTPPDPEEPKFLTDDSDRQQPLAKSG
jgi:uncharacterized membrane protein